MQLRFSVKKWYLADIVRKVYVLTVAILHISLKKCVKCLMKRDLKIAKLWPPIHWMNILFRIF